MIFNIFLIFGVMYLMNKFDDSRRAEDARKFRDRMDKKGKMREK